MNMFLYAHIYLLAYLYMCVHVYIMYTYIICCVNERESGPQLFGLLGEGSLEGGSSSMSGLLVV